MPEASEPLAPPTFHLEDDLGAVLALGGGHLTPVGAAVLEAGAPQQQGGVTADHQLGQQRGAAGQRPALLLVLLLVFSSFSVLLLLFGVSTAVVILMLMAVVAQLKLEDGNFLSEPLHGLPAGRREAAGQQTLLGQHAGHHHVYQEPQARGERERRRSSEMEEEQLE